MEENWNLATMKSRPNPYAKQLKEQITLWVSPDVIAYFKQMAEKTGVPNQSLINLYLQDCVNSQRTLQLSWES